MRCKAFAVLAAFAPSVYAAALKVATVSQGKSFFDAWNVNASVTDPTQYGNIHYLNQTAASQQRLMYVNDDGRAVLKADNTTNDPAPGQYSTFGRDSVLIISKDTINIGTLVVIDAVHIPYGCSVWPAFWTLDSVTKTDEGGEIDIIEAVNLMSSNQYSLHAREGCRLVNSTSLLYTGTPLFDDCNYVFNVTGNRGCGIAETAWPNSLGQPFAQNGGGVFAMYWANNGICFWFFPRNGIPRSLVQDAPDPDSTDWPRPSAAFPATGCDPAKFFNPQNMILNVNICGAWAGNADVFPTTGCGQYAKCTDLVGKASNYDQAYWEINYIKTYTATGAAQNSSASGSATGGTGASSTNSGANGVPVATTAPSGATRASVGAAWWGTVVAMIAALLA